jgi:hypothetical protein
VTGGGSLPNFREIWCPERGNGARGISRGTPGQNTHLPHRLAVRPLLYLVSVVHRVLIAELDIRMSNETDIRINTYRESLQPYWKQRIKAVYRLCLANCPGNDRSIRGTSP